MKGMLLYNVSPIETKPLKYENVKIPEINENEILVKIKACGVCRSNLHMIEGDWLDKGVPSKLPIIPGHEIVGIVEEVGKNVKNINVGDRVGIQPLYNSCGNCEFCIKGKENLCLRIDITGETVDGGYAEYIKALKNHIYEVPDNLKDEEAAPLFCPGVTAYRAVYLSEPFPGKKIAIFGIGGVGHLAIQFAKLAGAKVIAISRSKDHLKIAEELGADLVISSLEEDISSMISRVGHVDSSIVFAPSDSAISSAMELTKKSGIIVIGIRGSIIDFIFSKEQIIKGSVIGTRQDMRNVLEIASKGLLKIKIEKFKISEANEALYKLKKNLIKGRAVLIP